jgi:hypothetical protein
VQERLVEIFLKPTSLLLNHKTQHKAVFAPTKIWILSLEKDPFSHDPNKSHTLEGSRILKTM